MAARGEVPPFLGMPAHPIFARVGRWTTVPAFPNVTFRNPVFLEPEPGTRRLFVGELEGRIFAIDGADPTTQEKRLILDLSGHTQGGWDGGLLGLAFHPEYDRPKSPHRGFIFVWYSWVDKPVSGQPPPDLVTWTRLARFTVDPATGVADADTELVLINQRDRFVIHAGGGLFFHPGDGFLYATTGDEGVAASPENVQRVDRNLFSGVLRIDVDQRGGAISHPIRTRPADGETAHYFIPNDNPFVGVPGALEEFFALGLRSPHRMTYDPVDNLAWIGDIGRSAAEEISVLEFGRERRPLNFQWDIREGGRPGPGTTDRPKPPGIWTDPIFEYGRDQGVSVIGGYVYRGRRHPSLQGKYLFGDFGSGKLWALSYAKGAPPKRVGIELLGETASTGYNYRGTEGGLTSFGRSHDGELYLLHHGFYTHIAQLAPSAPQPGNLPTLLSQTGIFADVGSLTPSPGLVPYDVNLPHWTNGIPARHWISVPTGKRIRFSQEGRWRFPPGTVFVQHFEVPAEAAASGRAQRVETRVLVAAADGTYYTVGYRWKPDESDAELVASDDSRSLALREGGRPRNQPWSFSAPQKCLECHNPGAGHVLGLKTRQIDREFAYPGGGIDRQLRTWSHLGLFDAAPDEAARAAGHRLARPDDPTAGVEHRVRSYLDVNCAHCHGSSPVRAAWDGNFSTPLAAQHILFGPLVGEYSGPGNYVIAPKDVTGSILYRRAASRDITERMPPIDNAQPDASFVAVLRRWIEGMPREEQEPPHLVRARRRGEATVEVVFSEAVQAGSGEAGAERVKSYRLSDGAEVRAARLEEDLRTVTLTTTSLNPDRPYTLAVKSVADRADQPNAVVGEASIPVLR